MLLMSSNKIYRDSKPALFLDRDGVINIDHGYVHSVNNFDFIPGIFNLVRSAKIAGYLCVVVTNQAGIGRDIYSLAQFRCLSKWMCKEFKINRGLIDAIYYSPFHATKGKGQYLLNENTRKPGSGMFLEAIKDLNININKSIMVGDKISDMTASLSVNIPQNYLFLRSSKSSNTKFIDQRINIIKDLAAIEL